MPTTERGRRIADPDSGYHSEDCRISPDDGEPCDCGLVAMIEEAECARR